LYEFQENNRQGGLWSFCPEHWLASLGLTSYERVYNRIINFYDLFEI